MAREIDRVTQRIILGIGIALLAGCAAQSPGPSGTPPPALPPVAQASPTGERIAEIVLNMVGTPYRFGGAGPRGFDCSGLVYFAYGNVGIPVPRTAAAQRRAARPIQPRAVQPGDLVFFDTRWQQGHVGIYVGDGRFVHAPSSGKRVTVARLDQGFFAGRLTHAGRLY